MQGINGYGFCCGMVFNAKRYLDQYNFRMNAKMLFWSAAYYAYRIVPLTGALPWVLRSNAYFYVSPELANCFHLCFEESCSNDWLMSLLIRYVSAQPQVAHHSMYPTVSPAGPELFTTASSSPSNNPAQMDMLMRENERLRKELEAYTEKAARLQKVRENSLFNSNPYSGVINKTTG